MNSVREIKEDSFGGLLHQLRKAAWLSFDDFRIALGVTKTYLNDVETGFVRPPTPKMQIAMIHILSAKKPLSPEDIRKFFDYAAAARNELPADVFLFLKNNPNAVASLRNNADYRSYISKVF